MIRYSAIISLFLLLVSCTPPERGLRERYVRDNPGMKTEIKKAILNGNVIIGMTENQVYASRATPIFKGEKKRDGVSQEYWIYPDMKGSPFVNIYFSNKIVVAIEKTDEGPPAD